MKKSHNPYFNRWFSAMNLATIKGKYTGSHNPYFNRWFSAISSFQDYHNAEEESQSLF